MALLCRPEPLLREGRRPLRRFLPLRNPSSSRRCPSCTLVEPRITSVEADLPVWSMSTSPARALRHAFLSVERRAEHDSMSGVVSNDVSFGSFTARDPSLGVDPIHHPPLRPRRSRLSIPKPGNVIRARQLRPRLAPTASAPVEGSSQGGYWTASTDSGPPTWRLCRCVPLPRGPDHHHRPRRRRARAGSSHTAPRAFARRLSGAGVPSTLTSAATRGRGADCATYGARQHLPCLPARPRAVARWSAADSGLARGYHHDSASTVSPGPGRWPSSQAPRSASHDLRSRMRGALGSYLTSSSASGPRPAGAGPLGSDLAWFRRVNPFTSARLHASPWSALTAASTAAFVARDQ